MFVHIKSIVDNIFYAKCFIFINMFDELYLKILHTVKQRENLHRSNIKMAKHCEQIADVERNFSIYFNTKGSICIYGVDILFCLFGFFCNLYYICRCVFKKEEIRFNAQKL